nr:MAG TPA: hypothetical protein [Caudoviricetes sp.]
MLYVSQRSDVNQTQIKKHREVYKHKKAGREAD